MVKPCHLCFAFLALMSTSCSGPQFSSDQKKILKQKLGEVSNIPSEAVRQMCSATRTSCGIEQFGRDEAPTGHFLDYESRLKWRLLATGKEGTLKNYTVKEILREYQYRRPNYQWTFDGNVINIKPKEILAIDPLERRLATFSVKKMPSDQALEMAMSQARLPPSPNDRTTRPICAEITIDLKNMTLREVLNRIVAADGQVSWFVSWRAESDGTLYAYYVLTSYRGQTGGLRRTANREK